MSKEFFYGAGPKKGSGETPEEIAMKRVAGMGYDVVSTPTDVGGKLYFEVRGKDGKSSMVSEDGEKASEDLPEEMASEMKKTTKDGKPWFEVVK